MSNCPLYGSISFAALEPARIKFNSWKDGGMTRLSWPGWLVK